TRPAGGHDGPARRRLWCRRGHRNHRGQRHAGPARRPTLTRPPTVRWMDVFDDLEAEQDGLEAILALLDDSQWLTPSGAAGWSVADVVLHLAQSEEAVVSTAATLDRSSRWEREPGTLDELMDMAVAAERTEPKAVFERL